MSTDSPRPGAVDAIASDPQVRQLTRELDLLRVRRAQCSAALSRRVEQIRGLYAASADSALPLPGSATESAFLTSLDGFRVLSGAERLNMIRECYQIDHDDRLDLIPDLKGEYVALLSEFERKMGDEFPKTLLMRLVQIYRWMRTFWTRFLQPGAVLALIEARRVVDNFLCKTARLLEDDMRYVMEYRSRGLQFKLAEIAAAHQRPVRVPGAGAPNQHRQPLSAFRSVSPGL